MWSNGPADSRQPDTLAVHVNLEFDHSITSNRIKTVVKDEAAAIWRAHGVELLWPDSGAGSAALHLDVIVARHQTHVSLARSESVLGLATIDRSGVARGPIRIWLDAVESLLQEGFGNQWPAERKFAVALGRVLAHELGHVLLGAPTYHDRSGLMRARFPVDDLAGADRRRFQLTDRSAHRLRAHLAGLSDAQESERCTQTGASD
jgi:hypothetical protein